MASRLKTSEAIVCNLDPPSAMDAMRDLLVNSNVLRTGAVGGDNQIGRGADAIVIDRLATGILELFPVDPFTPQSVVSPVITAGWFLLA